MKTRHMRSIFLPLLVCLSACTVSTGSFCAIGIKSLGSTTHIGCLSIVQGRAIRDGRATGERQNLIYLMIICRDAKATADQSSGGGIEGDPMSDAIIYYDWKTTTGTAHVSLDWNTRSDTVSVEGQQFYRAKGNVFFIERKSDGKLIAKQCGDLPSTSDFAQIAMQIRQKLPDDDLVRSAKFQNVDK